MMKLKNLIVVLLAVISYSTLAQKIKLTHGNLKPLKGQTALNVEFSYDSMTVGNASEKDYIQQMKTRWNQTEAGKGDQWEQIWVEDRKTYYEPTFRHFLSKESGLSTNSQNASYTLILKTRHTEPGWHAGVMSLKATVEGEAHIVSSENPGNVIAKIVFAKFRATNDLGGDFEAGKRIQEAYMEAAKAFGQLIKSKISK